MDWAKLSQAEQSWAKPLVTFGNPCNIATNATEEVKGKNDV